MSIVLYHNPRCSKSRAALSLLHGKGIDVTVKAYLKEPLSAHQLHRLLSILGPRIGPMPDLIRHREAALLGIAIPTGHTAADNAQRIAKIIEHPILMERPIIATPNAAMIARPPEKVLDFIESVSS